MIKILNIVGKSGTGKTTIAEAICKNPQFNFIQSYTNRPKRYRDETCHMFVDDATICRLIKNDHCVASSQYGYYYYCSMLEQFDKDKINVYVTDIKGIMDLQEYANRSPIEMCNINIRKTDINVSSKRTDRDKEEIFLFDYVLQNDYSIENMVEFVDTIVKDLNW